mgnify:CR=1 FL=1
MKVSLDWITNWLPLTEAQAADPQRVSDILTASGLEVEGLEEMPAVPGGLKGMVVGEVLTCEPHPNADRLRVTTVDVGAGDPLPIVCGAPNVAAGQKVVVATVGSTCHPLEGEPFKIKKGKIRGEVSMGMICAEDELGIGSDHDGILVLDDSVEKGTPAASALGLQSDHCIEIGLTPNRTDAMGHRGVARDLRAAWKWNGGDGEGATVADLDAMPNLDLSEGSGPISLVVEDAQGAPLYLGVTLSGVKVGPSPDWMQQRLRTIGIEPKNNVVDITNYVLHDLGQPLHAFDADKVAGATVKVRRAKPGEAFTTLDGKALELDAADLVIADADKPMCLAGIFGGDHSGVTDTTTRVFLESAWFEPVTVRKSAKRHTLSTDASFRFERGIDPLTAGPGLQRAVSLLQEFAGASIEGGLQRAESDLPAPAEVRLNWGSLDQWVGVALDRARVRGILADLDIQVRAEDADGLDLTVPAYRRDVTRPADVVEEILRIHGYDHIPLPGRMKVSLSDRPHPDPERMRTEWAGILVARGFHETMHNSLVPASHLSLVEDEALHPDRAVTLLNPLSSELDTMRQTLIFQGLDTIARNRNHQSPDLSLFEFGKVYRENGEGGHEEEERLCLWVTGRTAPESWRGLPQDGMSFLKGAVDAILTRSHLSHAKAADLPPSDLFREGMALKAKGGFAARIGQIHPALARQFGVDDAVYCADLPVAGLLNGVSRGRIQAEELARFPWVRRDLSLVVPAGTTYAALESVVKQAAGKLLRDVNLFDVYTDDAGVTSYALSMTLQDPGKTLQDKAIDKTVQRVKDQLAQSLGVTLR